MDLQFANPHFAKRKRTLTQELRGLWQKRKRKGDVRGKGKL